MEKVRHPVHLWSHPASQICIIPMPMIYDICLATLESFQASISVIIISNILGADLFFSRLSHSDAVCFFLCSCAGVPCRLYQGPSKAWCHQRPSFRCLWLTGSLLMSIPIQLTGPNMSQHPCRSLRASPERIVRVGRTEFCLNEQEASDAVDLE